jgi:8-oxo-dGTP pyrophosphatase MutT (NUDIX family)
MISEIDGKNYRPTVFIVVYKKVVKKRVYLVLKRKLHWSGYEFPKGGIEEGEDEIAAVNREVFEETGLKAENIKDYNIGGKYDYSSKLPDRAGISGQSYSLYSVEVGDGDVKIDGREHSDYFWLSYLEALKKLSKPNQKECLRIVEFDKSNN